MIRNPAAWLSLSVVTVASGLTAFVVMPGFQTSGELPIEDARAAQETTATRFAALPAVKEEVPASADHAAGDVAAAAPVPADAIAAAAVIPAIPAAVGAPSFDVLRVEKDGSAVIAGRAAPNSRLEVHDGDSVVAWVEVGPSGDFATVLDEALPPGDHALTLKSTDAEGKATVSEEVAAVSIPVSRDGELLALVSRPGEASRLIAVPETVAESAVGDGEPQAPEAVPVEIAAVAPVEAVPAPPVAETRNSATPQPAVAAPLEEPAAITPPAGAPAEIAAAIPEARSIEPVPPAVATVAEEPAAPQPTAAPIVTAPVQTAIVVPETSASSPVFETGSAEATRPAVITAPVADIAPSRAAAPVAPPAVPREPIRVAAAPAELRIGAVEIEGDRIFIAGMAQTGARLRGDADGRVIGNAAASGEGRFVIEGRMALETGEHRIGVEALDRSGRPMLRVEVPFDRPEGEQIAAVAPAPEADEAIAEFDGGSFDRLRIEAVRSFGLLRGLYVNDKVPSLEQMLAARSAATIALKSLSEYRLPEHAGAASRVVADGAARHAGLALAALDALPGEVATVGGGLRRIGEMIARAVGPVIAHELQSADKDEAGESGVPVIRQAALAPSERASVIIRRGDTLWQISRRVYGQGVRYTTIYLANQDRIRNPDHIRPGQIFGVPDEALPDAEKLHRDRLRHKHH